MQCGISSNAMKILETRYLDGESVDSMWDRVSGGNPRFRDLLSSLRFLPNSPTLFNAGRNNGCTLSACFVLDVADTMFGRHSITETREKAIAVAKAGGGVGYYFGDIRPKGSPIKSVHRVACGPVAVLRDYHQIHKLITQGGKRDLAQMGVLPCFHQDIQEFIHCKDEDPQSLSSFNISVDWRDDWIKKAFQQMDENKPGKELNLWNEQVESAWKHGCPGMLFSDTVNRFNPNIHLGRINASNPCLVGDTLVATADGRRGVTIRELADKGDDVPVYCLNNDGEIVIRVMRHPRLTGVRQPIVKVHLDNGQCVRVTKNHKLLLTDGRYVEAQYLEAGDSLSILSRYEISDFSFIEAKGKKYLESSLINTIKKNVVNYTFSDSNKEYISKKCEYCGDTFTINYYDREISYCSINCAYANKLVNTISQQREEEILNHRVLWVEEDGYEDVYNGTVDEFHNFYIGEWDEGLTKKDLRCIRYINTLNCGETPNRNAEPCSLGSLSLPRYFNKHNRDINWNLLEEDVWTALEFMDDILDRNVFPHPDITEAALLTRKLGLGVMGWADLLALMHIHYDTEKAVNLGHELMKFINTIALDRSAELARTKGPYKGYSDLSDGPCVRNETRTSIAPTGTIAIIANVWGSIEPHFALSWDRTTNEGIKLKEKISCWDDLDGFVPKIANDIAPEWHVRHQAAYQSETNLGVSKTVNLPNSATKADVSRIYRMMYESGCKGGTVYRDGCRNEQVLVSEKTKSVFSLSNGSVKKKKKLPPERSSITHKFKVSGTDFFLTVGLFEEGEPGEIFVRASRLGSTICGMLDSWAITFSIALQNGTPLETLCRHHLGTRFEPSGMTDNKEIPICMSIPDYIVRWLDMKFITKSGDKPKGIDSGIYCPECGREAIYQAGCLNCTDRNCGWTKCG